MPLPPLTRRPRTFEILSKMPAKLSEAAVTLQIKDFLTQRGWYHERMMYISTSTPQGWLIIGRKGMEDNRYTYPLDKTRAGLSCTLLVENKATGVKTYCRCAERATAGKKGVCTACSQKNYRTEMEGRGFLFGPGDSIDKFMEWYEQTFAWLHDGTVAGQITLF